MEDQDSFKKGFLKVPVSLLGVFIFMTCQTSAAIWWAAQTSTTLHFLREAQVSMLIKIEENTKDRYTATEAAKDLKGVSIEIDSLELELNRISKQVNHFQSKYDSLLNDLMKQGRNP